MAATEQLLCLRLRRARLKVIKIMEISMPETRRRWRHSGQMKAELSAIQAIKWLSSGDGGAVNAVSKFTRFHSIMMEIKDLFKAEWQWLCAGAQADSDYRRTEAANNIYVCMIKAFSHNCMCVSVVCRLATVQRKPLAGVQRQTKATDLRWSAADLKGACAHGTHICSDARKQLQAPLQNAL